MRAFRRWAPWLGLSLWLAYALPLFAPPVPLGVVDPPAGAGAWQRVFVGVPAAWVVSRLLALVLGACLSIWGTRALSLRDLLDLHRVPAAPLGGATAGPWLLQGAVLVSAAYVAAAFFVERFDRLGEAVYFFFPAVPIALLAVHERRPLTRFVRRHRRPLLALLAIPAVWASGTLIATWHASSAATLVDAWTAAGRLEKLVSGEWKALLDAAIPGVTNAYLLLEGVTVLGLLGLPVTFGWLQVVHGLWMAVAGYALGVLAWRMLGVPAAVVAQASFLFSPFALVFCYDPLGRYILLLPVAVLLLLLHTLHATRSATVLVAFAVVAAFCLTTPHLTIMALLACAVAGRVVLRRGAAPRLAMAAAALCAAAVLLPAIPNAETIGAMADRYTKGEARMADITQILFGQRTVSTSLDAMEGGEPHPGDVVLGALLTPFATARTPLRLIGDAVLDPVSAVLLLVGLLWCARRWRRGAAAVLLGIVATGMAPALVASGNQVSHTRITPALVPLALLAAIGFEALARGLGARLRQERLAAVVAASMAASGVVMVFVVNPTILPSSWLAIAIEALDERATALRPLALEYGIGEDRIPWLNNEAIARLLPSEPMEVRTYSERDGSALSRADAGARLHLWSPALETEVGVWRAVCRRWPQAALYTLWDAPRLSRALAAMPQGERWLPALPPERWSAGTCTPAEPSGPAA
jgi:hypothetical protein